MHDKLNLTDQASYSLVRNRPVESRLDILGHYKAELYRGGKLVWLNQGKNTIMRAAKTAMLSMMFNGDNQYGTWYIGLINGTPTPLIDAGDLLSSHPGWTEYTAYFNGADGRPLERVTWETNSPSNGQVINSNAALFLINVTTPTLVSGIFVCTAGIQGINDGLLWAAAYFYGGGPTVQNGDELKVTYAVQM